MIGTIDDSVNSHVVAAAGCHTHTTTCPHETNAYAASLKVSSEIPTDHNVAASVLSNSADLQCWDSPCDIETQKVKERGTSTTLVEIRMNMLRTPPPLTGDNTTPTS